MITLTEQVHTNMSFTKRSSEHVTLFSLLWIILVLLPEYHSSIDPRSDTRHTTYHIKRIRRQTTDCDPPDTCSPEGSVIPDKGSCNNYYECVNGSYINQRCSGVNGSAEYFNMSSLECVDVFDENYCDTCQHILVSDSGFYTLPQELFTTAEHDSTTDRPNSTTGNVSTASIRGSDTSSTNGLPTTVDTTVTSQQLTDTISDTIPYASSSEGTLYTTITSMTTTDTTLETTLTSQQSGDTSTYIATDDQTSASISELITSTEATGMITNLDTSETQPSSTRSLNLDSTSVTQVPAKSTFSERFSSVTLASELSTLSKSTTGKSSERTTYKTVPGTDSSVIAIGATETVEQTEITSTNAVTYTSSTVVTSTTTKLPSVSSFFPSSTDATGIFASSTSSTTAAPFIPTTTAASQGRDRLRGPMIAAVVVPVVVAAAMIILGVVMGVRRRRSMYDARV